VSDISNQKAGLHTRDCHYMPRGYMRQWSADGSRVNTYRLLVPDARFPVWRERAIRSVAVFPDLYTTVASGHDSDAFERWLNENVENPATLALERARRGERLSLEDRRQLAYYAAALHVRNPTCYLENVERWNRELPAVLERSMAEVKQQIDAAAAEGRELPRAPETEPLDRFPLRVSIDRDQDKDVVLLRAEATIGRELWVHSIKHLLKTTAHVLESHRWSILRPAPGWEWFTSDNPLVRLNFTSDESYDFGGGWGRPKGDLILPLSPTILMHTMIGDEVIYDRTLDPGMTFRFQRMIAGNAFRWIIARGTPRKVEHIRPRIVNRDAFEAEESLKQRWHTLQAEAEKGSAEAAA
jgi:hypothetical protein